ncbi:valine--tRNA ligase [Candidatus Daviesbacteria bacterium]|nr:valine--tRNA ligase [Candidatus Daviesbacteria bacterium]
MDKTQNTEEKWYKFWENQGLFKADPDSSKPSYSILMPPPNLTGEPHAGHTIQHLIMDGLARFKRMQGFDVLFQPGVDHAGIQFEGTLNKLLEKEGLRKISLGREKWMERAWQFKGEIYKSFHKTWRAMGISADWKREVFTLDPKMQRAVLEEFKTFWEQDLLYKGAYIVQWCPKDATAIEDLEMEYEERTEKLYYVKYKVAGDPRYPNEEYIVVATARPETIYADVAIAVHPESRYKDYAGRDAYKPLAPSEKLVDREIKIITDDRVNKEFGTGALKITPGHDPLDYKIGKDHNLSILHAVDKAGGMTDLAGDLKGLSVSEAREKTAEMLDKQGSIDHIEEYTHSVPVCERCKSTIEPLVSEEWFVKMKPLAQKALKSLKDINFFPKNFEKVIADWLEEIHDWSISRSLWWGHRIPVWYCQKCNSNHEVGKDKDMVISLTHPEQNCQTCKLNQWVQDDQILDTWFSSGLWPMATLGWPSSAEASEGKPDEWLNMKKYYPYDFEISAPEIKFLWIARMIMLGVWFAQDIPFKNMFFTGTLRDLQGRKFSKSLGNGVFPLPLIDTWGVDAYRMAIFGFAAPARDGRASRQTLDERCKNFRNFVTKLKNIAKFIVDLKPKGTQSLDPSSLKGPALQDDQTENVILSAREESNPEDIEILEKLNKTIKNVTKELNKFNFHLASDFIYEFIWHEFADKYIESSKNRRKDAQPVLEYIFKTSLELLHPFMPFITEEIWQRLPHAEKSIMIAKWHEVK